MSTFIITIAGIVCDGNWDHNLLCDGKIDCMANCWSCQSCHKKSVSFAKRSVSTIRLLQFVRPADPV